MDKRGREDASLDLFPHDRVVFFSDAVFAIAMTLLAIELRIPTAELIARVGEADAWGETIAVFIAYVISFLVCALFWVAHMLTWKYIARATSGLVWCQVFQLLFVALMPLGTRLYSEAFMSGGSGRFAFYAFVLAGISCFGWLTRRIAAKQENLDERLGEMQARWYVMRGLIPLLVFAAAIPLAFAVPAWMGGFIFFAIFPLTLLLRRRYRQEEPSQA